MGYNDTSEDRVHKYCLNVPLSDCPTSSSWSALVARAKYLHFTSVKDYLLYLAKVDVENEILSPPERFVPKNQAKNFLTRHLS